MVNENEKAVLNTHVLKWVVLLWKFNSSGFDKCCKSWKIAVRILLGFRFNTHVYL